MCEQVGNALVIGTVVFGPRVRSPGGVDVINPCLLCLATADLLLVLLVLPLRVRLTSFQESTVLVYYSTRTQVLYSYLSTALVIH